MAARTPTGSSTPSALPGDPTYGQTLIPNEDSLVFEADESNIFEPSAVTNYDLWEGGARAALGLNASAEVGSDIRVSTVLARRWREEADPAFTQGSNLRDETSDYVAAVRADMSRIINVGARFRMDDDLAVSRVDVDASVNLWGIRGSANYFSVNENVMGEKEEGIVWSGSYAVNENWSAVAEQARNISLKEDVRLSLGLRYQDDCSFFLIAYEREGGRDRTLGPSESIRFTFALTGLGGMAGSDFD